MAEESSSSSSSGSSSSTGLDPKVSALLAYLLGIVGGIVFYAISKDGYVRFHAMQSILLWVAIIVIYFALFLMGMIVPFLWMIDWIVYVGLFAVEILMMIKAYQGERYKLPIIGGMAEQYSK